MLVEYFDHFLTSVNQYTGILLAALIAIPLVLAGWLWFFHDRHIKRLEIELIDLPEKINKQFEGRGATVRGIEPHLNAAKKLIESEIGKRKLARQLFLDRANLISLFRLK